MVYLVASLASMVMLVAGLSVIALTIRSSANRILGALLGQPIDRPVVVVSTMRQRTPVRVLTRRPMQPLRAAA